MGLPKVVLWGRNETFETKCGLPEKVAGLAERVVQSSADQAVRHQEGSSSLASLQSH